jgi:tRNA G10  N-methylase Trm11
MKTFFILGRNPELSRAEVNAFLDARSREYSEVFFEENFLVLETGDEEKLDIQEFGGVMKLGKILFEGSEEGFEQFIDGEDLVPSDKFSYALFGNLDTEILKDKFKREKRKAMLKHGRKKIKFQGGENVELPNADYYFFLHEFEEKIYFGVIDQDYDSFKVKERDMGKPVRREHLAISPRLAKILVNLSWAKRGELMLDPFCGIGGILQEALLKNIKVYGIDHDKSAVRDAEINLKWLSENYKFDAKWTLENNDSRKTPDLQFGAIATETPLGKVLRKKQSSNAAEKIIQDFEAFIVPILTRLKKCKRPSARIAITFPVVQGIRVDAEKVSNRSGLKLNGKPIPEFREDQFISRDIVIFS